MVAKTFGKKSVTWEWYLKPAMPFIQIQILSAFLKNWSRVPEDDVILTLSHFKSQSKEEKKMEYHKALLQKPCQQSLRISQGYLMYRSARESSHNLGIRLAY